MNEPFGVKVETVRELVEAMRQQDGTRPIIVDGIGDLAPDIINTEHYVNGIGKLPQNGGARDKIGLMAKPKPFGAAITHGKASRGWRPVFVCAASKAIPICAITCSIMRGRTMFPAKVAATELLETKVKNCGFQQSRNFAAAGKSLDASQHSADAAML